jgi:hypothetical protein
MHSPRKWPYAAILKASASGLNDVTRSISHARKDDSSSAWKSWKPQYSRIFPNLSALMALGSLAPFLLEVCLRRYSGLAGEMGDYFGYNVFAVLWKAPLELKSLEQNGEAEPRSASFIAQHGALLSGERPVLGEFVRMPVLLHRIQTLV